MIRMEDFLTADGKWQCTQCGACCKLMHLVPALTFLDRGDSVCVHLSDDNKCNIYNSRPIECRGDITYGPDLEPTKRAMMCHLVVGAATAHHKGESFELPGY